MYNKQKVLFVALENMERTRKFLPPSGLLEFCILSLYFVYSAPFLYVPLSLQRRICFTVNHHFASSQSHVCFHNITSFFLLITA